MNKTRVKRLLRRAMAAHRQRSLTHDGENRQEKFNLNNINLILILPGYNISETIQAGIETPYRKDLKY